MTQAQRNDQPGQQRAALREIFNAYQVIGAVGTGTSETVKSTTSTLQHTGQQCGDAKEAEETGDVGHFLRQSLTPGGNLEVDGRRGQVEKVGAFETTLQNEEQAWSIPNSTLLDSIKSR